jgi:hypothetical protein
MEVTFAQPFDEPAWHRNAIFRSLCQYDPADMLPYSVFSVDVKHIDVHSVACDEELVLDISTFGRCEMELAVAIEMLEVRMDKFATSAWEVRSDKIITGVQLRSFSPELENLEWGIRQVFLLGIHQYDP